MLQDALKEATENHSPHSSLEKKKQGVGGDGRKGSEEIAKEVEEKGLKPSITEGGKLRKKQGNHFLQVSGREVSARSVETLGVDLGTTIKQLGAEEKARRN